MAHNCIDVHQHVVQPFPAQTPPSSRRRSVGHRYSAAVAQGSDELHGIPKTRATGEDTSRQRRHGGSPREGNRSLRRRDPVVPDISDVRREDHFAETCSVQDEVNAELAPAATDEVLVAAAKSGNHSAFVELWKRHSNTAFKMAYRVTGNRDDAEDVIQDAWMKAYVHLKTFDGRAKFSTWLTRIAINSALMTLRKRRSHPETPMEINDGETWQQWEIADQTKDVEELYARHETVERLRRAIGRLQPILRSVVEIHQSNEGSVKELAELAGISVAATKSRLLRARTILRRALD
jgi:RNA polymerase sigma-70 factor (ECF subfamily)